MNQLQPNPFPALFMTVGFAVLAGGVWWIYRPAALIVAGLVLLGLGYFGRSFGGGR
jgi:hypothetical protein